MKIAPDKILHLKAGVAVAIATAIAAAVMQQLGLQPLSIALVLAGIGAGAAVEWSQRDSNARLAAIGAPALHGVSAADLLASAAPCLVLAAALELLL